MLRPQTSLYILISCLKGTRRPCILVELALLSLKESLGHAAWKRLTLQSTREQFAQCLRLACKAGVTHQLLSCLSLRHIYETGFTMFHPAVSQGLIKRLNASQMLRWKMRSVLLTENETTKDCGNPLMERTHFSSTAQPRLQDIFGLPHRKQPLGRIELISLTRRWKQ